MPAHYNDITFFYPDYWQSRQYQHHSELIAIRSLLQYRRFHQAVDIGGGYGRLTTLLTAYSPRITLVEPSLKQRLLAKKYLTSSPRISIVAGSAEKTHLPALSQDLALVIRVFHHLPHP